MWSHHQRLLRQSLIDLDRRQLRRPSRVPLPFPSSFSFSSPMSGLFGKVAQYLGTEVLVSLPVPVPKQRGAARLRKPKRHQKLDMPDFITTNSLARTGEEASRE